MVTIDSILSVDFMGAAIAQKTPLDYKGNSIDNAVGTYTSKAGLGPITAYGNNVKSIIYHLDQLSAFRRSFAWYEKNHEQVFDKYAATKGLKAANIVAIGSKDLHPSAVGGIAVDGDSALLLSNRDFFDKIMKMGHNYGLTTKESLILFYDHEKTHALGIKDELGVYTYTRDMYRDLASKSSGETKEMYNRLAKTCDTRVKEYSKLEQKASESMPYAG